MAKLRSPLLLAFLVVLSGPSVYATPVLPDGSYLVPYTNLWKLVIAKDGKELGSSTWSDETTSVVIDGRRAMRRVQVITGKRGSLTYVNVFDPKTLRPIAGSFSGSNGDYFERRFSADGRSVRTIEARGENRALPQEHNASLTEPVFDYNGGMYGLILRGLPLAVGLSGTIPSLDATGDQILQVPYRVIGRETVEAKPGTTVMTWVVDADFVTADHKEDGSVFRFYLADTAPFVIKLVFTDPNQKIVQTFTMI